MNIETSPEFDEFYKKLSMGEKLIITKDTLRFLLDTNDPRESINKVLKKCIGFISDELEFSTGLK